MKPCWYIEYEIPPLRAIYKAYGDDPNEAQARVRFAEAFPLAKIRKVLPLCMACECPIDKDGCGCNPHDA